jgi:N utilization substance protein B
MGARSSGREAALRMLYSLDEAHDPSLVDDVIRDFWRELATDPEGRDYANELVRKVCGARSEIDDQIRKASRHWRLERMARVDRNVLRLGVQELRGGEDVPRAVVIDEAVELAKRFGAEGSGVFVNGVLDRIAEDLGKR